MAKTGQKRKRAEKAKTQLKTSMKAAGKADKKKKVKGQSGIKLPKGLNEVKPEVKTKAIVVSSRAAPVDREEVAKTGKRYRPLKDVLSKLRHHSHFNRTGALNALKEILVDCPSTIEGHRFDILRRLLPLAMDTEGQVRTIFLDVFKTILPLFTHSQLCSHSELIGAHISSALAHVAPDVQRDALKAVDILLQCAPEVVGRCHQTILPNCMSQLSESAFSSSSSAKTRLSTGVENKAGAVQGHLDVLKRIKTILKQLVPIAMKKNGLDTFQTVVALNNAEWATKNGRPGLLKDRGKRGIVVGSGLSLLDIANGWSFSAVHMQPDDNVVKSANEQASFVHQVSGRLVPLLMDCWREVIPDNMAKGKKKKGSQVALEREGMETMLEVMEITLALLDVQEEKSWYFASTAKANEFADLALHTLNSISSLGEGPNGLFQQLRLRIIATCLKLLSDGDLALKLIMELKDQRMLPRTPEGRSLLLEVLQLLFDGYVRTGDCASLKLEDPFLALVNRLYCSRAEGNGTEEGEAVSNLMLDIFRHRDLATVRSWVESVPAKMASGQAGDSHLEAVRHAARTADHEAVSVLEEGFQAAKNTFFSVSVDANYVTKSLRVLSTFCAQTKSRRGGECLREVFHKYKSELGFPDKQYVEKCALIANGL